MADFWVNLRLTQKPDHFQKELQQCFSIFLFSKVLIPNQFSSLSFLNICLFTFFGFRVWVLGMGLRPSTYSEPFL